MSRAGTVDDFCETVFFTGNGRLGVRGFGAWQRKSTPQAHAIFKSGLFSEIKPGITDMVQLPDALTLRPSGLEPETVEQALDMRCGVLWQTWHTDRADLYMERTVSMADGQLILQRLTLTPKTDGVYRVEAIADAKVCNLPVHDDQMVAATELATLLGLEELAEGRMRLATLREHTPVELRWQLTDDRCATREHHTEEQAGVTVLTATLLAGQPWTLEKRVRVLVNDETANPDVADPWAESAEAWHALWEDCDLEVDSDDPELQGAIRYNIFQMLANRATPDRAASIGARGLSHGRYKGNTFWDTEIFMKFFGLLGGCFLVPTLIFGMMFLIHYLKVGYFSGYLFAGLIAAFCLLIAVLMFSFGVAMESMVRINRNENRILYQQRKIAPVTPEGDLRILLQ